MNNFLKHVQNLWKLMGPGLLYAGAAVGVSHLVQSTRAGALYGFILIGVIILVNALKYPFFEFATRYATATKHNLITGYSRIGSWAVWMFALLTILTMFAIQAAVTIVTAGLTAHIFDLNISPLWLSMIILSLAYALLLAGRFAALDNSIKIVILLLSVSTLIAVFSVIGKTSGHDFTANFSFSNPTDLVFLIAFVGWMPAPLDVSVWQSLWTVEKNRSLKCTLNMKQSMLDFRIGYFGTALLAMGFLALGALVMYGSGEELAGSGVAFSGQLISMYTTAIGPWAYWVIAIAALTTMISTTLTCMDAYPRVMTPLTIRLIPRARRWNKNNQLYIIWGLVVIIGAGIVLSGQSMQKMVDLATTLSFITAPLLALLNHLAVTRSGMPNAAIPPKWLRIYSLASIIILSAFSLYYLGYKYL